MMNLKTATQKQRKEAGFIEEENFTGFSYKGTVRQAHIEEVEKYLLAYVWSSKETLAYNTWIETRLIICGVTEITNHDLKIKVEL